MTKVVDIHTACEQIRSDQTVCLSGFVGTGTPESLIKGLEQRFLETGAPRDLTLVFAAAPGDGASRGANRLAHPDLVRRVIGGHWALVPKLGARALANEIEAYNLPLGVISQQFREIAGHRSGLLTKIGLGTFVDPRFEGAKLNARTTESLVELTHLGGEEWLWYKPFAIDVAFIRATSADPDGNLSMENEALTLDTLAIATATRNSGGIVIAQVERTVARHALSPRDVEVPGIFVDHVVVADKDDHRQTWATQFSSAYAGHHRVDTNDGPPSPLTPRKVIARRAAQELVPGAVVNLGIGIPEGVATVAAEEGYLDEVTLTAEPGVIGGMPQGGLNFGAAVNNAALLRQNQQFDFYDGGGLDLAVLGMAEADACGNVNVSRFGTKLAGAGGFINISQSAKSLVFAGTFSAGATIDVRDGRLVILQDGPVCKFVNHVEQVTFNGERAARLGQRVLYVTERCVLELTAGGLRLAEVAPGIDIDRDIRARLPFDVDSSNVRSMDAALFHADPIPKVEPAPPLTSAA